MQSAKSITRALCLTLALMCPFFLGASGDKNFQKANDEISRMSETEREHLKRNYENFKQLTPAQLETITRFHETLQQDQAASGTIHQTMDEYIAWLNKISPYDRVKLRDMKDPMQRISEVERIMIDRERDDPAVMFMISRMRLANILFPGKNMDRFMYTRPLTKIELDMMRRILERHMKNLPASYQGYSQLQGSDRLIKVLRWWTVDIPDSSTNWVPDNILQELKVCIKNPDLLDWVNSKGPTDSRPRLLLTLLKSTVLMEITDVARTIKVTPEKADAILGGMDQRAKEFVSTLPVDKYQRLLANMVLAESLKNGSKTLKSTELVKLATEKHLRAYLNRSPDGPRDGDGFRGGPGGFRGPGGPNGPGGGRDGRDGPGGGGPGGRGGGFGPPRDGNGPSMDRSNDNPGEKSSNKSTEKSDDKPAVKSD